YRPRGQRRSDAAALAHRGYHARRARHGGLRRRDRHDHTEGRSAEGRHRASSDTLTMRAWSAASLAAALISLAAPQQPAFRSGANYVRVDAYPTISGKPAEDLTAADFRVLEDGKPQTIDTFE